MDGFLDGFGIGQLLTDSLGRSRSLCDDHIAFAQPGGILLVYVLVCHSFLGRVDMGVAYVLSQYLVAFRNMTDYLLIEFCVFASSAD